MSDYREMLPKEREKYLLLLNNLYEIGYTVTPELDIIKEF